MIKASTVVALVLSLGCSSETANDKCSSGQIWSANENGCVQADAGNSSAGQSSVDPSAAGAGSGSTSAAGADSDSTSAAGAPSQGNFFAPCATDADCAGGIATLCLGNPMDPSVQAI
jgi:hypothetical protein